MEDKITMTATVMKVQKEFPAPNKYNKVTQQWKKAVGPKITGTYNNRAEKISFVDEAKAHGMTIPTTKAPPIDLEIIR